MKKIVIIVFLGLMGLGFSEFVEYPIDGYERTGIKRLKRLEMIKNGELKESTPLPAGAMKSWEEIKLNLLSKKAASQHAQQGRDEGRRWYRCRITCNVGLPRHAKCQWSLPWPRPWPRP